MRRPFVFLLDEAQEGLFTDRPEPVGHLCAIAPARGELGQEGVNLRIGIHVQDGLETVATRPGQVHKEGQAYHREAADGHPVAEQFAPRSLKIFRENPVKLKRNSNPEREAHDDALAIVETILKKDTHPHNEEDRHQHDEIGRHHLIRYGHHNGHAFRQKGQHDEEDAHPHAHRTGRHPGHFGDGDPHRIGRVGHRPGKAGEQIAQAVGGERALNRAEVDGARPTPRGALDRNAVADRVERANERHHHKGRQQRPEGRAEAEVEAGPGDCG